MTTNEAIQLLLILLNRTAVLGAAINKARAEGRDDLSDEELKAFRDSDDAAKDALQSEIDSRS